MSLLTLPRVYVDESNSTGENLLDPAQPIFSLSAVNIRDDLATALIDDVIKQLPKGHGEANILPWQRLAADEQH